MALPVNTVPPAITGSAIVGQDLTCTQGTWTGGVQTFAFQWQETPAYADNGFANIAGATQNIYTVQVTDIGRKIRCMVTATNNTGSVTAESNEVGPVPADVLIVEDGTGKIDANSFCSLEFANEYFAKRSDTQWVNLTIGQKKAALIEATDYMEQVYRLMWLGYRKSEQQSLSWPRDEVKRRDFTFLNQWSFYPDNQVPEEVKKACADLAKRAGLATVLAPDIARVTEREKVGPLEVTYDKGMPVYTRYRAVDNILAPFLVSLPGGAFRSVEAG